jgi:hypothetical protein
MREGVPKKLLQRIVPAAAPLASKALMAYT